MRLTDLVFIVVVLTVVSTLLGAARAALRRQRIDAGRRARLALGIAVGYLALVAVIGALSAGTVLAPGEDYCSEDWCIAVVHTTPAATPGRIEVTFRLSSKARRIRQRERFVATYLVDAGGRRIGPEPAPDQPPFDALLKPGQSLVTVREFTAPSVAGSRVVITREGGGNFPRCCILGDDDSFFHPRASAPLDPVLSR